METLTSPPSGHHDGPPNELSEGLTASKSKIVNTSPLQFWLLSIGIYTGFFLAMMDATIVAPSLHTISIDFDVFESVNWVALAYTLAECSCSAVFGRVSDTFGRRNTFIIANSLFFVFSLACGFSQNLDQLIAFRVLQGVGGAGLYSLTMIIMPEVCPDQLVEYMAAIGGITMVASFMVGPILGGILTQYATWRWIFWINGPICITSMAFFLYFWPRAKDILAVTRRPWKSFDYIGSVVLIGGSILVVFAFQMVGISLNSSWGSAAFIAPTTIGLACWLALFIWEYMVEHSFVQRIVPIFPLSLFRNRFYVSMVIGTLFTGFPIFLLIFSVPLRAQLVSDKNPLSASITMLPMLGAGAIGCITVVGISLRRNFFSETLFLGAAITALGCGLLTTVSDTGDERKLIGYIVVAGFGCGLSIGAATCSIPFIISPQDYAPAQAIVAQARVLGGSFGISTSTVLLHNEVTRLTGGQIPPQLLALLGDAEAKLPSGLRDVVRDACSRAFRNSMIVSAAISGATVLLALIGFRRHHPVTKQQRLDLVESEYMKSAQV